MYKKEDNEQKLQVTLLGNGLGSTTPEWVKEDLDRECLTNG